MAFFGSTGFSCMILEALQQSSHQVTVVVTQPDHPAGRSMQLCPTDVCRFAEELKLPALRPDTLKHNADFRRQLKEFKPEALIVASYGQIVPRRVLELCEWPLNVHASLLPRLRGASPVREALLLGLQESGCTMMRMTPRMDDGDILLQQTVEIGTDWNFSDLLRRLGEIGAPLAVKALDTVEQGEAELVAQNHEEATYCYARKREDSYINWSRTAKQLHDFIRAWDPDVGACTSLADGSRFKIWRSRVEQPPIDVDYAAAPGTVVAVSKKAAWLATGDGILRLMEVQPANRGRMPMASFLAGHEFCQGEQLGVCELE